MALLTVSNIALQNEYDKSFSLQCMSVFYKGFYDAFTNRVNRPGKKRKFIELYLYAQGIIYANYISSLKSCYAETPQPGWITKASAAGFARQTGSAEGTGYS